MTTVKGNIAATETSNEQQLTVNDINFLELKFFDFLLDKQNVDLEYNYNILEKTLRGTVKTSDLAKDVKQIEASIADACRQVYKLQEQQFRATDDFVNDWENSVENGNVFVFRSKHQFAIMATKKHAHTFNECKRKFEVKVLKLSYYTFEKIEVRILNDSIENLDDVDAIVNPTDKKFEQKGTVSKFLSRKGGTVYDEICKHLKTSKSFRRSKSKKCFVTDWGDNERTKILHAVCPVIDKEKPQDVQTIVYETVYNCLKTAEDEGIDTVAIPLVYTGRGNVPVDKCALPYAQAVLQFSMERESAFCVNRIDFIDLDQEKTEILFSLFDELLPRNVSQYFEMPIRENAEIRKAVRKEHNGIKEISIPTEEKDIKLSNTPLTTHGHVRSFYDDDAAAADDDGYEKIDTQVNRSPLNETVSKSQHPDDVTGSDAVDEIVVIEKNDGYENIKFADATDDEDGSSEPLNSKLESTNSDTDYGYDTIDDKTKPISDKNNMVVSKEHISKDRAKEHISKDRAKEHISKDRVETLRSGLTIIHDDVENSIKRETTTEFEGCQTTRETSNIGNENGKVLSTNVKDPKHSRPGRPVENDTCKVREEKNKGDQNKIMCMKNSSDKNTESIKDTVNDTLRSDSKEVGNLMIIDDTKHDPAFAEKDGVEHNADVDKTVSDYVNVQQQELLDDDIDTCDYGSVNAKNGSEQVSRDSKRDKVDTKADIEKQINSEEKRLDTDEKIKEKQLVDKNQSLDVPHCDTEIVEESIKEKGDNKSDKPYCDISVEKQEMDHNYYNIEQVSKPEAPPIHEPEQVSQSLYEVDSICQNFEDNYDTKFAAGHTVHIFKGDIRQAESGAIICPEIPNTKYGGIIAVAIKCAFRNVVSVEIPQKLIKSKGKRIATTHIRQTRGADNIEEEYVSFIYHVQAPVYQTTDDEKGLTHCIDLIFKKLKKHRKRKVKRIYIPLLGIEDVSNEDNVKTCCHILVKTIHKNLKDHKCLRDPVEVMLVNRCKRITDMLIKEMKVITDSPL